MKCRMLAAVLLLASGAGCASAPAPAGPVARETAPRRLLRGSECLDPAMARSWIDLGRDSLLVDAGRHKYRVTVSGACSAVDWSPVLVFRGDPVSGRVCGSLGDAILTRDYPCTILDMQLLDAEQYKALLKDHEAGRHRKAAVAPPGR